MQSASSIFFIGLAIGLSIAILGGLSDYWLSSRNNSNQRRQVPGCMMYIAGALGLIGIVALIVSFIISGSFGPAFWLGAGVLGGFYAGFAILIVLYFVIYHFWTGR